MEHYGQVDASATIYIPFTTHSAVGAAVAPLSAYESADVKIYKNGSATERTSANGLTMTSPFDSITGLHLLAIDLSDNTDAGFYAAGSRYFVVLSADTETVDGQTVVRVLADFSIGPVAANTTQLGGSTIDQSSGLINANVKQISTDATAADNAEAFFDGTGYAGTNNVIPTVTTTTNLTNKGDGSGFTAIPWNAAWDAEVQSEAQDALDAVLADSVPADGSRPSLAQAAYMIVQFLTERAVSGTTVTVKKVDGATSLMTFTLDDATLPTSITRS